ncbi:MAG: hypothetical protein EOP85_23365 [Verrucomicrobiaceae bacterium]|nr:MAG: hypothetical protein EOP85_23365 [Verrucomicrobiaceae bacterium]
MKAIPEDPSLLARKIEEAEMKLERLELEIEEIGLPAGFELRRRLEALKIEERALKRNFEESRLRGEPDSTRMEKIEALLHHVEREESSVRHDADFLHQAAPSSMALAVQAGAHIVDLYRRGLKHVIGDHHLLGESVFVNHTHENLTKQYGLSSSGDGPPVRHVADL